MTTKLRQPFSETRMPQLGDRVECLSPWGFVQGVVTALYPAFEYVSAGELIRLEAKVAIRCDSVPKSWPYSTYEFAPAADTVYPETKEL